MAATWPDPYVTPDLLEFSKGRLLTSADKWLADFPLWCASTSRRQETGLQLAPADRAGSG
jgi:hypothetical protein